MKPGQKLIFYSTYAKPAVVAQAAAPVKTIAVVLPETTAVSKLPKNPDFPTLVGADKFVYGQKPKPALNSPQDAA